MGPDRRGDGSMPDFFRISREGMPAPPWKADGQGCEKRPIGLVEGWSVDLAPKDSELVAKHEDLDVLLVGGAEPEGDKLYGSARHPVEEAESHGLAPSQVQLYATAGWTSLPWLHRITAPTLVLTGAKDPIVPPVNARIVGARIPDAAVHVVPDAGHLLLMDRAMRCAELIAGFLSNTSCRRDRSSQ